MNATLPLRLPLVLGVALGVCALTTGSRVWAYDNFINNHRGPLPSLGGGQGNVTSGDIDVIENLGQRLPAGLVFSDAQGRPVALDGLLHHGKPLLLTLGYYNCPMLCNLVHEGLVKSIKAAGLHLGADFQALAVSIDPNEKADSARDNQGRLLRALDHQDAADWPFVVDNSGPDAPVSAALAQAVGFRYKYDGASKQFAHAAVAFVITAEGKISRYLYGVDFSPRDLRFALVEAGGGRVGTTLDRVLLACFKYDPMVHRYTPFLWSFVRIGAFLSFLALASLLAVLWRREVVMRKGEGRAA